MHDAERMQLFKAAYYDLDMLVPVIFRHTGLLCDQWESLHHMDIYRYVCPAVLELHSIFNGPKHQKTGSLHHFCLGSGTSSADCCVSVMLFLVTLFGWYQLAIQLTLMLQTRRWQILSLLYAGVQLWMQQYSECWEIAFWWHPGSQKRNLDNG